MNGQPAAAPLPTLLPCDWRWGWLVLIAALSSGLNDRVTDIALADIRAALGISYDRGSWLIAGYQAAEVAAMMIAPVRRYALPAPIRACRGVRLRPGRGAAAFVTHYPLFLSCACCRASSAALCRRC